MVDSWIRERSSSLANQVKDQEVQNGTHIYIYAKMHVNMPSVKRCGLQQQEGVLTSPSRVGFLHSTGLLHPFWVESFSKNRTCKRDHKGSPEGDRGASVKYVQLQCSFVCHSPNV